MKKIKMVRFEIIKTSVIKAVALFAIAGFSWLGFSSTVGTEAYLSNTEISHENPFVAGTLDFVLNSPSDFTPSVISPGESATRIIDFLNITNIPQYNVTATSFAGALCEYLNLEVSLDGGGILYSGSLTEFLQGPVVFEAPDVWLFTLILPSDAPADAQGQTCQFDFVFFGSQTRNDLEFGFGFNDVEDINNNIASGHCYDSETRSKGYWKNHPSVYLPHLPQYLGCQEGSLNCVEGNEEINNEPQVTAIIGADYSLSMRNKLRGQLLGMKFNVAHFGVGDYLVESQGKTINQIIAEADNLLRQDSEPEEAILKAMKDLLESLVDLQIRVCSLLPSPVIEPEMLNANIVINEFLPNPAGQDNALLPNGEWIELYNNTGAYANVAGWWLYDVQNSHELAITNANTNTGDTLIPDGGFLVVYRNGDNDFSLNNTGRDTLRLYSGEIGSGILIDSYTYTVDAPEGKSFARFPDGSNNWIDPTPTPGEENTADNGEAVFGPAVSEPDEIIDDGDILIVEEQLETEDDEPTITATEEFIIFGGGIFVEVPANNEDDDTDTTEEIIILDATEEPATTEEPVTENPTDEESIDEEEIEEGEDVEEIEQGLSEIELAELSDIDANITIDTETESQ